MIKISKFIFFCACAIFLNPFMPPLCYAEIEINSMFIPVYQGFDFEKGTIVDIDEGDINVLPYGIDASSLKVEIASLHKGFIKDMDKLPLDEEITWRDLENLEIDMLYAVKCKNGNYALLELVDVKLSGEDVIGIEIKYRYQPNGTKDFN